MTEEEAKEYLEGCYSLVVDDVSYFLNAYKRVVGGRVDFSSLPDFFDHVDVSEAEVEDD